MDELRAPSLVRLLISARAELAAVEQTLNSLNVFPVPDGDTGTNMRSTLEAALSAINDSDDHEDDSVNHADAALDSPDQDMNRGRCRGGEVESGQRPTESRSPHERTVPLASEPQVVDRSGSVTNPGGPASAQPPATDMDAVLRDRMLRALTVEAQGNSGVILAEYIRGFIEGAPWSSPWSLDAAGVVTALAAAADRARGAVDRPVEGTILSVADAAAEAAKTVAPGARLADVTRAAMTAARTSVQHTRDNLAELTQAGVIDAGGAGLTILLECLHRTATGRNGLPASSERDWLPLSRGSSLVEAGACAVAPDGPAYEFMAVVDNLDEAGASELRQQLGELGESVVLAGGGGTYRLHVHTDDVLKAASLARSAGRISAPSVTRFEGPLEAMAGTVVLTADAVLRQWAVALGARDRLPEPSTTKAEPRPKKSKGADSKDRLPRDLLPKGLALKDASPKQDTPTPAAPAAPGVSKDAVCEEAAVKPQGGPLPPASDDMPAIDAILVDSSTPVPSQFESKVSGMRASLHVALELESRAIAAQWGTLDDADSGLPIYRADSWRAGRDLARRHFAEAESVIIALQDSPETHSARLDEIKRELPEDAEVTVLRLVSKFLLQLAGE